MTDGWTDGRMDGPLQGPASGTNKLCCCTPHLTLEHWSLSYFLEGDIVTVRRTAGLRNGRTEGGDCNIPIAFIN